MALHLLKRLGEDFRRVRNTVQCNMQFWTSHIYVTEQIKAPILFTCCQYIVNLHWTPQALSDNPQGGGGAWAPGSSLQAMSPHTERHGDKEGQAIQAVKTQAGDAIGGDSGIREGKCVTASGGWGGGGWIGTRRRKRGRGEITKVLKGRDYGLKRTF